jgi:hypothetical protein
MATFLLQYTTKQPFLQSHEQGSANSWNFFPNEMVINFDESGK